MFAPLFSQVVFPAMFSAVFVGVFAPNYPLYVYVHEIFVRILFFRLAFFMWHKKEQPNQIKMVGVVKNAGLSFSMSLHMCTIILLFLPSYFFFRLSPFIRIVVCVDFLTE